MKGDIFHHPREPKGRWPHHFQFINYARSRVTTQEIVLFLFSCEDPQRGVVGAGKITASRIRRQRQLRPRLVARPDARADENVQRLRLLQRIDRVLADPLEFEADAPR